MKLLPHFILIFLLTAQTTFAQSPYELSWKKDLMFIGIGTGLFGAGYLLENTITPLTESDLQNLNPSDVNSFDRSALNQFSEAAGLRSDIGFGLSVLPAVPICLLAPRSDRSTYWQQITNLLVIGFETNLITVGSMELTKNLTQRLRPLAYNENAPLSDRLDIDAQKSFFSGHTSVAAANAFLFAKIYSDYFPESKYRKYFWAAAIVLPAWVGIERYYAGKHYPTDILVGYAVGAGIGYLIPHLHKKKDKKTTFMIFPRVNTEQVGFNLFATF